MLVGYLSEAALHICSFSLFPLYIHNLIIASFGISYPILTLLKDSIASVYLCVLKLFASACDPCRGVCCWCSLKIIHYSQ